MNNGWDHELMAAGLTALGRELGATAYREFPVPGGLGFIDVVFETTVGRVAGEIEVSSPKRARHGFEKAVLVHASFLLTVCPNRRVARLAARRMRGHHVPGLTVFVGPYGAARQYLTAILSGHSVNDTENEQKTKAAQPSNDPSDHATAPPQAQGQEL